MIGISSVGFTPIGPVQGRSVFHASAREPDCFEDGLVRADVDEHWLQTSGWERALQRLRQHCQKMSGDGVIAVRLTFKRKGNQIEFLAAGTAVRSVGREHIRWPFTAHLDDHEFANLMSAGWVPAGVVVGIAMQRRHRGRANLPGTEQRDRTQVIGQTLEAARRHLEEEASRYGAEGVVVRGIQQEFEITECRRRDSYTDLAAKVAIVGTAIAQFRSGGRSPLTVMPLGTAR